ncbi:hypothetical protein CALVIDRAFT_600689 [Calocera viscosa TUFC12733]|uniref:Zn(2)-C6 fungal-type domain-containing protein n=1 Tax=Calocera viscosa (strain TUFC12733) TaxID=1330018 RepID=A0A167JD37_CALVF|nr:hypothetical protein CALVIDRAFT_600689 [Calocera viscosa TUFC12733]
MSKTRALVTALRPPTHIMGLQHTTHISSPDSESSMEIDSDDESDFSENASHVANRPVTSPTVRKPSWLDGLGPPLRPTSTHGAGSRRGGDISTRTVSFQSRPSRGKPPLWIPGCSTCNKDNVKSECRAWPGRIACTTCYKRHRRCNLEETNSERKRFVTSEPMPSTVRRPHPRNSGIAPRPNRRSPSYDAHDLPMKRPDLKRAASPDPPMVVQSKRPRVVTTTQTRRGEPSTLAAAMAVHARLHRPLASGPVAIKKAMVVKKEEESDDEIQIIEPPSRPVLPSVTKQERTVITEMSNLRLKLKEVLGKEAFSMVDEAFRESERKMQDSFA